MEAAKGDILLRLKKIEGQIKGIQGMIEKEECCSNVLVQIAAVRAAINKVGGLMLENYSKQCILNTLNSDTEEKNIDQLIDTMLKFLK